LYVIIKELKIITASRIVWLAGLYGCIMYFPLSVLSDAWAVHFIKSLHGISQAEASSMTSLVLIGSCIAAPIGASISDRIHMRIPIMRLASALGFLTTGWLFFLPAISKLVTCGLLVLIGSVSAGQILVFAVATESSPSRLAGTASGVTNMLVMSSGAIITPLIGIILDLLWSGKYDAMRQPIYTLSNYRWAMSLVCIGMALAFLITFLIPETFPEHLKRRTK